MPKIKKKDLIKFVAEKTYGGQYVRINKGLTNITISRDLIKHLGWDEEDKYFFFYTNKEKSIIAISSARPEEVGVVKLCKNRSYFLISARSFLHSVKAIPGRKTFSYDEEEDLLIIEAR